MSGQRRVVETDPAAPVDAAEVPIALFQGGGSQAPERRVAGSRLFDRNSARYHNRGGRRAVLPAFVHGVDVEVAVKRARRVCYVGC